MRDPNIRRPNADLLREADIRRDPMIQRKITPRAPLLLLPMRLEYRVVDRSAPPMVLQRSAHSKAMAELRARLAKVERGDAQTLRRLEQERADLIAKAKAHRPTLEPAKLRTQTELWMRWYPDDNFAEEGVAPPSPVEAEALAAFLDHPSARDWPKVEDEIGLALWGALAAVAGPARAVHLMRQQGQNDPDWEARIGRITGLPAQIALFAAINGKLEMLGQGAMIPANEDGAGLVSYAPNVLGDGAWMSDFDEAIAQGMGLKLTDPDLVGTALKADWIICTGIGQARGVQELSQLIVDRRAAGAFAILGQDTATNNTPTAQPGRVVEDSVQAQLSDHTALELGMAGKPGLDADLLAQALGLDAAELNKAPGAGEDGHLAAAAMIRVIGPALLDGSLEATQLLDDVSDPDFIEVLAQHVQARGVLPALKIGSGAYGVLPILDPTTQSEIANDLPKPEQYFTRFVRTYAKTVLPLLQNRAAQTSFRIEPDDPAAAEKLSDILQSSRVSRRIDLTNMGESAVKAMACPYVEGQDDAYAPATYLSSITRKRLRELDDPDEDNTKWPLLYRLALLSLRRSREIEVLKGSAGFTGRGDLRHIQGNWMVGLQGFQRRAITQARNYSVQQFSNVPPATLTRLPQNRIPKLQAINARYLGAITHLRQIAGRPYGTAQLEILMMEVIDLFQHRLDAWITALASIQLTDQRQRQKVTGLALGYYGMLGPLRRTSATGTNDGYIQAASQGQAVSAAILRSAYLRSRNEGAFEIDLSSGRTSRALRLMDHIRHGVPLPEALGLRGERWLRDTQKSLEIFNLRAAYPLENVDADGQGTAGPNGSRCFDGLKLVEEDSADLPAKHHGVQAALRDDLDALSDLVVAEAVHQRAGGAADVAAAWLRVLSGGPIPHRPEFLRTHRSGHASDYRVSLILPPTPRTQAGSPLRLANAALADLFTHSFPELASDPVDIQLNLDNQTLYEATLRPDRHLGLDAISIAKLGPESLRRRLVDFAISDMQAKLRNEDVAKLGAHLDRRGLEAAGMVVTLTWAELEQEARAAAGLWALVHRAEPLSAGDLSNAADPDHILDEPQHIAALQGAALDMWARTDTVLTHLKTQRRTYLQLLRTVFATIAARYERPRIVWGTDIRQDGRLRAQVAKLHANLRALHMLHVDGADACHAASRLVGSMVASEAEYRQIDAVLAARITALQATIRTRNAMTTTLAAARADLKSAISAVQMAVGVSALALPPVFAKTAPLAPLLHPAQTVVGALGPWPQYRAKLAEMVANTAPGHLAYSVRPDATANDKTANDNTNGDQRDERLAPRAYHRGIFIGHSADMEASTISGLVIDDWVETRPSTQQDAAIALNYDSPQAEAPNSLLLCVAQADAQKNWTPQSAAGHVRAMLDLMQARALSTQTTMMSETVLPLANRVAHIGNGNTERPRIPQVQYAIKPLDWFERSDLLTSVSDAALLQNQTIVNQISPFTRPRGTSK